MLKAKSKWSPESEANSYVENTGLTETIQKMVNSLAAERDPDPVIYMIRYLAFYRTEEQLAKHGIVFTGEFPQKRPLIWFPEFREEWKSLLKEWLTEGLWRELKKGETRFKGYIQHWVQLGVYDQNDEVGVFAIDEDAYTKFDKLFMPIVCKIHRGYDGEAKFKSDMDLKVLNQFSKLEEFKNKISLIRISARRNFKDYAFTPLINAKDKNEIQVKIMESITEFKGKYFILNEIDDEIKSWLESVGIDINRNKSHDSAGINEDWPSGRGVIINDNKAFVILVNFEDHIQVFTISEDGDFRNNLKDLIKILSKFNEIGYAKHNSLGFLTASPKNLGTAMEFYVWIKLKEYKIDQIDEKKYSWKINNIDKKEGIYEVTYNKTLDKGLTENKAISQFLACLLKLTENEKTDEEEKQIEIAKQQAKDKKKNDKIDPQI